MSGDTRDLARRLLAAARARGAVVATAESCTGGLIAAAITEVAGASDILDCGFVTYSNAAKERLLGVRAATLAAHGAVSEEVAAEMARGALRAAPGATLAVSVTGIAGPGGSGHKPEGRVCFGLASAQGCRTGTVEFGAPGRAGVRAGATRHALQMLLDALGG